MNYTEQAKEALRIAGTIAKELEHPYVGTEHLLLGLRKVYSGVAGQMCIRDSMEYRVFAFLQNNLHPEKNLMNSFWKR